MLGLCSDRDIPLADSAITKKNNHSGWHNNSLTISKMNSLTISTIFLNMIFFGVLLHVGRSTGPSCWFETGISRMSDDDCSVSTIYSVLNTSRPIFLIGMPMRMLRFGNDRYQSLIIAIAFPFVCAIATISLIHFWKLWSILWWLSNETLKMLVRWPQRKIGSETHNGFSFRFDLFKFSVLCLIDLPVFCFESANCRFHVEWKVLLYMECFILCVAFLFYDVDIVHYIYWKLLKAILRIKLRHQSFRMIYK